jgi:hypothetical protein
MRWTENATIAQQEVGYAEYPSYHASGPSSVAGGLTTRRGDATRRAQPAVTPRLCQISRVCLSRHSDRGRCGLQCDCRRRHLMEARGLRKPRVFMSFLAVVVSSFGALTQGRTPGPSALPFCRIGGALVHSARADLLTIAVRRGPTLIR